MRIILFITLALNTFSQTTEADYNEVFSLDNDTNRSSVYDSYNTNCDISTSEGLITNDYYVQDYGAVGDGSTNDLSAIQAAVKAVADDPYAANLHFEAGKTYRCVGRGRILDFNGVKNKVVYGNGAEIIIQPTLLGIQISDCENVTVKDLTFDSDPLSWTQGTITAVDEINKKFTLDIDPGYPIPTNNYSNPNRAHPWGMLWEPTGYTIKDELIFITASSTPSGNTVQLTVRDDMVSKLASMKVNDRFTVDTYGVGGSLNRVIGSKDITIQNITIYATRGLAFVLNNNVGALRMDGIEIRRRPGTDRMLSGYRDGFHCKGNIVGPVIENCYIEGICDDAINLSIHFYFVTGVTSATQFQLYDASSFEVGDTISFVDMNNGVELGKASVASKSGNNITTSIAIGGVVAGEPRTRTPTFVMNLSKSNSGFIIRNNNFGGQRRYAMLIRCQNGLIKGNKGEKLGGGIILTSEIASFFEGPFPRNITIQNNSFTNIRGWPLWLWTRTYASVPDQLVQDIRLYNNTFGPSDKGEAAATFDHVSKVELVGNIFIDHASTGGIVMKNSRNITIGCNNNYNGTPILSIDDGIELISHMNLNDVTFECTPNSLENIEEAIPFYIYREGDLLFIISEMNISDVTLVNTSGVVIRKIPDRQRTINITGLPSGIYVVKVKIADRIQVSKVVL